MYLALLLLLMLQAQQPDQLASLEGKVFEAATQTPVRKASVSLMVGSGKDRVEMIATTDDAGVFRFADLKPCECRLLVEKSGFLPGGYGETKPRDRERLLTLRSGEHRGNVVLTLFPGGVLSGRVLDADGDGLPDRTVSVWKRHRPRHKTEPDHPVDLVTTNAAGEYRFDSLEPGGYYISANKESIPSEYRVEVDQNGKPIKEHELRTFFPGSVLMTDAQAVAVTPGQEMNGIDIRMLRGVSPSVKGRISGVTGPMSRYSLQAFNDSNGPGIEGHIYANGDFLFDSMPQRTMGIYLSSRNSNGRRLAATTEVVIGDQNLSGVQLYVQRPARVRVRIVAEDEGHPRAGDEVQLCSDTGVCEASQPEVRDAAYIFDGVAPGKYSVESQEMLQGHFLKSLQFDGRTVSGRPFDVRDGANLDLVATYSKSFGRVTGEIKESEEDKSKSISVILVAEDNQVNSFVRDLSVSDTLHFKDDRLKPGKYLAFAAEDGVREFWDDPDVISLLRSSGTEFEIAENGAAKLQLDIVPQSDIESVRQKLGF